MYIYDELCDEKYFVGFEDEKTIDKYEKIMHSDLSLLRTYISICKSNNIDIMIKPRVDNNIYCKCIMHCDDNCRLRIVEDIKAFCCYECGQAGTIVTFISKLYGLEMDESIDLLYSYISNDIDMLNKKQLDMLKEIFQYYDLPIAEKALEDSKKKSEELNERIKRYINNNKCDSDSAIKIANRLCCSEKYVNRFLPKKTYTFEDIFNKTK